MPAKNLKINCDPGSALSVVSSELESQPGPGTVCGVLPVCKNRQVKLISDSNRLQGSM